MRKLIFITFLFCGVQAVAQRGYVERAIEKKYADKYGKPGADKGHDWINNHLLNVKVEPTYSFQSDHKMQITSYKNGEVKSESVIHYYFTSGSTIVGMEGMEQNKKKKSNADMFTIYDYKNNSMVMLDRSKKTGTAINLNAFMSKENIEKRQQGSSSNDGKKSQTDCKLTGKTKSILGVSCEEFICEDKENGTRTEVWVNRKISGKALEAQRTGPMGMYQFGGGVGGWMMQALIYKNGELESKMETIEINNKTTTIPTQEYQINGF